MPTDESTTLHERFAALLDVATGEIEPFATVDTFNDDQQIEGFLCKRADHRYGALVIYKVRGCRTDPQVIYCTPKLHYPFGRTDDEERVYHFPKVVRRVEVYDKLDGTNVCAYSYVDADGQRFVTYKTRLTPILPDGKWGAFATLWRELLATDPKLAALIEMFSTGMLGVALSFEMYGYRNCHTVVYREPLAATLLFVIVQHSGEVETPLAGIAWTPKPVATLDSAESLVAFYEEKRGEAEARNTVIASGESEQIDGTEGFIFYVLDEDAAWSMWKCKPESIEALHWAGEFLPMSVILPTARNALEAVDVLTVDVVRELLLEEFSETRVTASHNRIEKAVAGLLEQMAWRAEVTTAYQETGWTFDADGKGPVMRALSQRFDRAKLKAVFTALKEAGLA